MSKFHIEKKLWDLENRQNRPKEGVPILLLFFFFFFFMAVGPRQGQGPPPGSQTLCYASRRHVKKVSSAKSYRIRTALAFEYAF